MRIFNGPVNVIRVQIQEVNNRKCLRSKCISIHDAEFKYILKLILQTLKKNSNRQRRTLPK